MGNNVDAPIIVNKTSGEYYKQPFFYALGHFSKFLSPDSHRIGVQIYDPTPSTALEVTAFTRPDNSTVVIVLNRNDEPIPLAIKDPVYGFTQNVIKANSMQSYIWFD